MPSKSKLRHFEDVADLYNSASDEEILEWVNKLNYWNEQRAHLSRMYRMRQQLFSKVARKLLDKDEVERIEARAVEAAEEELERQQKEARSAHTPEGV